MTLLESPELPNRLGGALRAPSRIRQLRLTPTPAAVLVPLYVDRVTWHILFTQRTDSVDVHKGQVSFPGGRIEPSDRRYVDTALREASEEINLRPGDVQVLGEMDEFPTLTGFVVTPVVALIPWPYPLRPNPIEVASTFGVPLDWLAEPANVETRKYTSPFSPAEVPVHFFRPYDGHTIWGATARIALRLVEIIRGLE